MNSSAKRIFFLLAGLVLFGLACQILPAGKAGKGREETFSAKTVTVRARAGWTDTGVRVRPAARLKIRALSGEWSPWPGGSYDAIGFGGDPRCDCNVIPAVSHAALIARIGDSAPFLVGEALDLRTGESGALYLGINDVDLADNSGSLQVEVQVQAQ